MDHDPDCWPNHCHPDCPIGGAKSTQVIVGQVKIDTLHRTSSVPAEKQIRYELRAMARGVVERGLMSTPTFRSSMNAILQIRRVVGGHPAFRTVEIEGDDTLVIVVSDASDFDIIDGMPCRGFTTRVEERGREDPTGVCTPPFGDARP